MSHEAQTQNPRQRGPDSSFQICKMLARVEQLVLFQKLLHAVQEIQILAQRWEALLYELPWRLEAACFGGCSSVSTNFVGCATGFSSVKAMYPGLFVYRNFTVLSPSQLSFLPISKSPPKTKQVLKHVTTPQTPSFHHQTSSSSFVTFVSVASSGPAFQVYSLVHLLQISLLPVCLLLPSYSIASIQTLIATQFLCYHSLPFPLLSPFHPLL